MAEGEKLIAEFPSVRHKKQDGALLLTSARVVWSAGELFQVNYPYHQIKGYKINLVMSVHVSILSVNSEISTRKVG